MIRQKLTAWSELRFLLMTLFLQNSASSLRHSRVEVSDCSRLFGFFFRLKSSSSDDSPSPKSNFEAEMFLNGLFVTFYLCSGTKFRAILAAGLVFSCARLAILATSQRIDLQGSHRLRFQCALQLSPLFWTAICPLLACAPFQNLR